MKNKSIPKAVVQEDPSGCGVACVAFVLGLTYPAALKLFKKGEYKADNCGFYCQEMTEVLNNQGKDFELKYIKEKIKRKIYRDHTIIFIKRSKKYPAGHLLCRYKNIWMDPWINFQKNKNIKKAEAGFRKRLPGKPIYAILPKTSFQSVSSY